METKRRISNSLNIVLFFIFLVFGMYAAEGKSQAGIIQGTVKDVGSGLPISGIYAEAFEVNFGYISTGCVPPSPLSNTTDSNGQFSLCVWDGIYKVFFRRTNASISYVGQWWNGATSYSGATPVPTPGGGTVTGINAAMTTTGGGFISGRVTGPNDAGVPNVSVSVYDYDQKVISKRGLVSAVTDISGNYTIFSPLPPGSYKIQFSDGNPGNNNLIEWWDDKAGFSTADQFVVTAGGANKANCKLSEGGIITGTVTDGSNSPIQSASIAVYDQSQAYVTTVYTDVAGTYSIKRLPTGNYKVKFSGPYGSNLAYQWYDNQASFSQASWVPVVVGSTTANINAQLIVGGTITGLTTTGTVLPAGINATVNVYDEYRNKVASWPSSSNGTFSVAGLPTGRYKVEFFGYILGGPSLGSTWFNGHRTFDSAEWIWVNAGSTTPDVNGHLVPAVIISGKVTDTLGAAISKVTVRVYDDATLGQLNPYDGTDSFGNFTVKNISPGSSRLYYDSFGTGFFPGWWDGKKMITEATPIDLISGQTYPNKDAVLDPSKEVYLPLILNK